MTQKKPQESEVRRKRPLVALGYAYMFLFLFSLPSIRPLTDEMNRMYWAFNVGIYIEFSLYLLAGAVVLAACFVAIDKLTSSHDKLNSGFRGLVVGWNAGCVLLLYFDQSSYILFGTPVLVDVVTYPGAIVLLAGIPFALLPRISKKVGLALTTAAKVFAPLPIVFLVYFMGVTQYKHTYEDPVPAPSPPDDPAPVLLVVLDGLDNQRLLQKGAVPSRFSNLHTLASTGTTFTDPNTPGLRTDLAMPRLLYQDKRVEFHPDNTYSAGENANLDNLPSWFEIVGREGDVRVLLGFHLDYETIVGDRVDWLRAPADRYAPLREGLPANMRTHAYLVASSVHIPLLSQTAFVKDYYNDRWEYLTQDIHASVLYAVDEYGPSLMGVFHYPLPHPPYVFDKTGRRDGASLDENEEYLRNLDYMDRLLGELFASMKRQHLWDSSTIIVTGDHGWPWGRADRVPPILIKLPGQTSARVVHEPLNTADIAAWLHQQPEFTDRRPPASGN